MPLEARERMNVAVDASDSATNDLHFSHKKVEICGSQVCFADFNALNRHDLVKYTVPPDDPCSIYARVPRSSASYQFSRTKSTVVISFSFRLSSFRLHISFVNYCPAALRIQYLGGLGRTQNVDRSLDNGVLTALVVYRKRQRLESLHNMSRQRRLLFLASRTTEYGGMSATGL